jgi:RimJ/RimL family protein N-acetyltransferase
MPQKTDDAETTKPIELRPLREEDIDETYLSWFRDEQVTQFLESQNISYQDAVDHLRRGIEKDLYRLYGIWHLATNTHIGNIKLGPISWKHGIADCVTVIGRREFWGRGLATIAIRAAIRIAFEELGLRKLSAGIIDGNIGSLKAYTRAGFIIECHLKGQCLVNGEVRDGIMIGCFNPKYFFEP